MSLFHSHVWCDEARQVVRPVDRSLRMRWATPEDVQDVLYGFTLVRQRCEKCGKQRTTKLRGVWA